MQYTIIPIFIIGSARNGTTNLENTIASLPQVGAVEHWLHYGSCESSIYMHQNYWGDLSSSDDYINFLYEYSSSDYFQLANGDIQYHLKRKRGNFYEFFFDLMDRHAKKENKKYWVSKLDPHFFMDAKEKNSFFDLLETRYTEVKFIRIKREFGAAFKSYLNMEGKNHDARQRSINLMPALCLQASRYVLTYADNWERHEILDIPFEKYIRDRRGYLKKISHFLGIAVNNIGHLNIDRFQVNSSFVKKKKKDLPSFIKSLTIPLIKFLKKFPGMARFIWKFYFRMKPQSNPSFRRLIKYEYYQDELLKDLSSSKANGLIQKISKLEYYN